MVPRLRIISYCVGNAFMVHVLDEHIDIYMYIVYTCIYIYIYIRTCCYGHLTLNEGADRERAYFCDNTCVDSDCKQTIWLPPIAFLAS